MPSSFWFNHFLDSRAEIHQMFLFDSLDNFRHQKVILKLTDLYRDQNHCSWAQCTWKKIDSHFNNSYFHLYPVSYVENTSINIWSLVFDILWGYNRSTLASLVGHFKRYFTCTNSSQFSIQFYYLSCFVVTKEKRIYTYTYREKCVKVQTLWKGHKIWKKSPTCFGKTAVFTQ